MADTTLNLVEKQLRTSLAASPSFRALCGVEGALLAAARVHLNDLPEPEDGQKYTKDELETLRPYAMIFWPHDHGLRFTADAMGSSRQYQPSGKIFLRISRPEPGNVNRAQAEYDWFNAVCAIMEDLCEVSGSSEDEYICFEMIRVASGPGRHAPDYDPTEGEELGVDLEIIWGTRTG